MTRIYLHLTILLTSFIAIAAENLLVLNDQEYFEIPGLNVMVFHDFYPEGHQGGVSYIQNGERIASNGDIRLEPAPGQWQPVPKIIERSVIKDNNEIRVTLSYPDSSRDKKGFNPIEYPDLNFTYTIRVIGENRSFRIIVDLDEPISAEWVGKVGFNLELFPGLLFGKSYYMDNQFGFFPQQANGPMFVDDDGELQITPMAKGHNFTIAPESESLKCTIESSENTLQLIDGRGKHNNGWFIIRSVIESGKSDRAIEWVVTPSVIKGWMHSPVIHNSQVGYHPAQKKIAVIGLDKNDHKFHPVKLYRIESNGQFTEVLSSQPSLWGQFLRYNYLQFDFTMITDQGLYYIRYGNSKTNPFQISKDIYNRHVWQPTLEYFLPVQMCHMKIMDRYRIWHGLCHMDDALMAQTDHNHFDGYKQGSSTLTSFQALEPVPGLNTGGWHDAGDYDLRIESQSGTVYILSLAHEAFNIDYDATTIDFQNHFVDMHMPDGKPDILQQIEHGVHTILSGYRSLGRLYRGIICPTLRQYVLLGDGSTMTDNQVFKNRKNSKENPSLIMDDRWVFTENNPERELQVAASLAAASRVLKKYNDTLSTECLDVATQLWKLNQTAKNRLKINTAIELFLTTQKEDYQNFLIHEEKTIIENIKWSGWAIGRIMPDLNNPVFTKSIRKALIEYKKGSDEQLKETPFNVPYKPHIWGAGWNIQRYGVNQYYLHTGFPDIFPREGLFNALNFVLGCHPGDNSASFASGIGAKSVTVAYGVNRADWSFIPGGVVSGTALIRPDFPELKEWPFLWQQTEYVIGGGASNFMFMVLAAKQLLNK